MTTITATNLIYCEDLTAKAKAVYTYLAYRSNKNNTCFPGLRRIAKDCSISVSSVQRAISELLTAGLLVKKPNYRADGSQTTNLYTLMEQKIKKTEAKIKNCEGRIRKTQQEKIVDKEKQIKMDIATEVIMDPVDLQVDDEISAVLRQDQKSIQIQPQGQDQRKGTNEQKLQIFKQKYEYANGCAMLTLEKLKLKVLRRIMKTLKFRCLTRGANHDD